ncbi:MAG: hypothetical protein NTZ49_02120 [Candidatus Parcubacteria bacterium]|nr:hypothetical protein [Candidatus Parcubacteria bacterium]
MKDDSIQVLGVFTTHRLIQMDIECPHCNGTLFRHYPDGTLVCVKCLNTVLNSEPKGEQS